MPTYDYECRECHEGLTVVRKITDQSAQVCPKCGKPMVRLLGKPLFVLRGAGWAKDGYGR